MSALQNTRNCIPGAFQVCPIVPCCESIRLGKKIIFDHMESIKIILREYTKSRNDVFCSNSCIHIMNIILVIYFVTFIFCVTYLMDRVAGLLVTLKSF